MVGKVFFFKLNNSYLWLGFILNLQNFFLCLNINLKLGIFTNYAILWYYYFLQKLIRSYKLSFFLKVLIFLQIFIKHYIWNITCFYISTMNSLMKFLFFMVNYNKNFWWYGINCSSSNEMNSCSRWGFLNLFLCITPKKNRMYYFWK